jgi:hypothetical protein
MSHGKWRKAKKLLKASKGGKKLNTSFIERFNALIPINEEKLGRTKENHQLFC